ncbi:MAG: hypothetical protein WEB04_03850 [Dehalococcoidia bacterium]
MGRRIGLGLVLFVAVMLTACTRGGGGNGGVELPPLTPFSADLASQLESLADQAADARELDVNDEIEQGSLTRQQLQAYYFESTADITDEDLADFEAFNTAYRLLGMIGPDDDLVDIITTFYGGDTLGFYDPDENKMVLVADAPSELSALDESVLVHEYVHSSQDLRFDLNKLGELADQEEEDRANTEYRETIEALVEGDATFAEGLYVFNRDDEGGFDEFDNDPGSAAEGPPIPPAFQRYFSFPYQYGGDFVGYLYQQGGWDEVNRAWEDPPRTEEQIMHPSKYTQGEEAIALKSEDYSGDLGSGWREQTDALFGEFDVYNWLYANTNEDSASARAADGWGGGRIRLYSNDDAEGHVLLQISLFWDSSDEARDFYQLFGDVVRRIDDTPDVLDPSGQIVSWQSADQTGRAWIQNKSFSMVIATHGEDLPQALDVFEEPGQIAPSDVILP